MRLPTFERIFPTNGCFNDTLSRETNSIPDALNKNTVQNVINSQILSISTNWGFGIQWRCCLSTLNKDVSLIHFVSLLSKDFHNIHNNLDLKSQYMARFHDWGHHVQKRKILSTISKLNVQTLIIQVSNFDCFRQYQSMSEESIQS